MNGENLEIQPTIGSKQCVVKNSSQVRECPSTGDSKESYRHTRIPLSDISKDLGGCSKQGERNAGLY